MGGAFFPFADLLNFKKLDRLPDADDESFIIVIPRVDLLVCRRTIMQISSTSSRTKKTETPATEIISVLFMAAFPDLGAPLGPFTVANVVLVVITTGFGTPGATGGCCTPSPHCLT